MPKESAIGGQLWEQYSDTVDARMAEPRYLGDISEAEAAALGCRLLVVDWGAEACGDSVRLYWAVDAATDTVRRARFHSFGCGSAIASSDLMCELCEGRTVDQVLQLTNLAIERGLRDPDAPQTPAVPPQKMHCSVMAHDVIKKAVAMYRGVSPDSLEDSQMLCHCARVTVGTVREAIRLNGLTTVEDVAHFTKAGAFCRSCVCPGGHEKRQHYIVDLLAEARREREQAQGRFAYFINAEEDERIELAQRVVDREVVPLLPTSDDWRSSCEVVQVLERSDGSVAVFVKCTGPCASSADQHAKTLAIVDEHLKATYGPSICGV